MLGSTIIEFTPKIKGAVREAWQDASIALAAEARVAMAAMKRGATLGAGLDLRATAGRSEMLRRRQAL